MERSDEMLIEQIQSGQTDSFDALMQRHQVYVYKIAYSFARNTDQAMDITQNVFLKAYQNIDRFKGLSKFRTWLSRITINESQNWVKKQKRTEPLHEPDSYHSPDKHQDQEFLDKEQRLQLLQSIYGLNTRYRLAVVLRYFENYPIADIAEVLDCSEGMVKNMLFRSLKKLRQTVKVKDN